MTDPEVITVYGRRLRIVINGPDGSRRYNAVVTVLDSGRLLTRSPVRGRSPADARDRALEVMYTLLGIERFHEQILAVAAEMAPGATVELTEDAQAIHADLSGGWELTAPLTVARDTVTDPGTDFAALRAQIEGHFHTHLRRLAR
ncbi:MAG TPA: hypothetical protein VFV60_06235 [bacterium]|nr:hypothetical protein [bacterium]